MRGGAALRRAARGASSVSTNARASPSQVSRTTLGKQVPVYTEFKNGRTRRLTVVRRVTGSEAALARELYRVTGGATITVHAGRVEVEGDRSKELKTWLMGLGF